jgi:hypothetical protein
MTTTSVMLLLNIPPRDVQAGETRVERAQAWRKSVIEVKRSVVDQLAAHSDAGSVTDVLGADDPLFANLTLRGDAESLAKLLPTIRLYREVSDVVNEPEFVLPQPVTD